MKEWAENECRIACKRENPDYDFNSDEFDYGCCCYKSALKAYNSLCEDGHSGMSWGFTKNILIRLMDGLPLTPITEEDFNVEPLVDMPDEWLKKKGLKSQKQCPRMSSLFREEHLDGRVTYSDVNRSYFVDIDNPRFTYHSWDGFLDEMFPIELPYMPKEGKYIIYTRDFLTDKKNGDFDTKGILYMTTPEGEKIDLNIYRAEVNGEWKEITKEEYEERYSRRINKR